MQSDWPGCETFIKAHGGYPSKTRLCFFNHRDRYLIIGSLLHDRMVQNKTVLIFDDTHPQTQFHGNACFPLADPFGMGLKDRKVLDNPRPPAVVYGVTGWDKSKYQDEMEYIESHGGHTICQVGDAAVLDGKQINGISVFKGMDRFLLDNPGLEWVIAHAPPDMEFIVPDRLSSNINGVLRHYAAIPITPGIALITPTVFLCQRCLAPAQIQFMNSIAKKFSRVYYFASNLGAVL